MKYMEKGGFQNNSLMKLTLSLTLLFLMGLWVTNFLLVSKKMGFTPTSIVDYYRGSEEKFIVARSFLSMLEVTHIHLPMMAIVLLLLTHLLLFAPFRPGVKVAFILTAFLSALSGEASGWLIRYVSPTFATLKIASFVIFQAVLAFLILGLLWFLLSSPSTRPHRKIDHPHSHPKGFPGT